MALTLSKNAFAGVKTSEVVYTGNPYTPEVPESVTISADTLYKGTDYTVEYTNNTNAGLATITITSKPGSNYTFETINKTFTIKKAQIRFEAKQLREAVCRQCSVYCKGRRLLLHLRRQRARCRAEGPDRTGSR